MLVRRGNVGASMRQGQNWMGCLRGRDGPGGLLDGTGMLLMARKSKTTGSDCSPLPASQIVPSYCVAMEGQGSSLEFLS